MPLSKTHTTHTCRHSQPHANIQQQKTHNPTTPTLATATHEAGLSTSPAGVQTKHGPAQDARTRVHTRGSSSACSHHHTRGARAAGRGSSRRTRGRRQPTHIRGGGASDLRRPRWTLSDMVIFYWFDKMLYLFKL